MEHLPQGRRHVTRCALQKNWTSMLPRAGGQRTLRSVFSKQEPACCPLSPFVTLKPRVEWYTKSMSLEYEPASERSWAAYISKRVLQADWTKRICQETMTRVLEETEPACCPHAGDLVALTSTPVTATQHSCNRIQGYLAHKKPPPSRTTIGP